MFGVRDRYDAGLDAGAGKSLQLTIRALTQSVEFGELPRAGRDEGLRKQQNDLLDRALRIAARRGAEEERQRILALLAAPARGIAAAQIVEGENVRPLRLGRSR